MTAAPQPDLFQQEARAPGGALEVCCQCEMCRPDDPGPTYTKAFRHECEVRYVVGLPSNERRTEYLNEVHKARGFVDYQRLRSASWNLMQRVGAEP